MVRVRRRAVIVGIPVAVMLVSVLWCSYGSIWGRVGQARAWVVSVDHMLGVVVCEYTTNDPFILPVNQHTVIEDQRDTDTSQLVSRDALQPGQQVTYSAGSLCIENLCLPLGYYATNPLMYPEVTSITIQKDGPPTDCPGWDW